MPTNFIIWLGMFLNISDIKSLDFTVTRFLMKLLESSNINLINESRYYFNFLLPTGLLMKRKENLWPLKVYWITLPFSNLYVLSYSLCLVKFI